MARRPSTAAIFDLDRTLIAGPSAPAFSDSLAAAGITQPARPGADVVAAIVPGARRDRAHRARPPGWPPGPRPAGRSRPSSAAAEAAADELMRPGAAVRPRRDRGAPRRRAAARDGDDQPGAARHARSPSASASTPSSPPGGRPTTAPTPASIDGPLVWGRGKLEAVREWADGRTASTCAQLVRLQRQLLRRPAARRRRPPGRRQPRRPPRRPGPPAGLADPPLRPARGRAQDRRARAAGVDPAPAAPRAAAQRPPRHRRRREDPARRAR